MFTPNFIAVLKKEDIDKIIAKLAHRISKNYENRELVLIGVLKGAFIFFADLIRCLTISAKVDFVRLASYESGTSSSGRVQLRKEIEVVVKRGFLVGYGLENFRRITPDISRVIGIYCYTDPHIQHFIDIVVFPAHN